MTEGQPQAADATAAFANMIEMARLQRLSVTELFGYAEGRAMAGAHAEAIEVYKAWLAYNEAHPLLHLVYFNFAVMVRQVGDLTGSIHALRMALKLDPKFGHAHINLGRAYEDAGLGVLAINQWRNFIELTAEATPDKVTHRVMVLQHIGRVMENAGLLEEAEPYLWQAIELRPDKLETGQHWSAIRQRLCKWPILTPSDHVSLRQLIDALSPLALGSYSDDPIFQLAKAYRYNKSLVGRPDTSGHPRKAVAEKVGTGARLRVGYVSSDLRDHAVGFALREVLELHDKERVEIYAYYCGDPVVNDPTQNRMKAAIDCWREIGQMTDEDAARLIAADDIDILIDVNGYTKHARTRIFAYRPAPVIVNFCGYPGSMASPFHQYMITDELVVPEENRVYYSETVKYIPCTQPVDRKRLIAAKPSRKDAGLPEKAFVYACFNGMQKITEATFGQWMQILSSVPKSVLWILTGGDSVDQRLRDLAKAAGIEPERIIFAPKAGNAQHLARVGVADLFLDTFPYGAHSTAADALTVGLPVLTFPGKTFAARFCHSIVHAAGLADLICNGPEDYVARAIAFGRDPKSLQKVRDQLAAHRETSVLRDMPGLARRLEDIYWEMQEEAERGKTPVPDLRNMDVYYEVGAELVQANLVYQDDATYRAQYLDRLSALHDFAPIPFDNRLWTEDAAACR